MDGIEVLRFIKDNKLSIKCIVNTVVDDEERLSIVNALKPDKILVKPFDNNQLLSQINAVIRGSK
jgi:DNA-binding NarL/FixJ family response regulator